jgi:hypothetical protein
MSNESLTTTPETETPTTKPGKGGLLFALGMALALVLLVVLNMG